MSSPTSRRSFSASARIAWLLFAARELISSNSTPDVVGGFFGTAVWLIASACLFVYVTTPKPGLSANITEKDQ